MRQIDRAASSFWQEAGGVTQMRGNRTLSLTDLIFIFERWGLNKPIRISLEGIQSIE